MHILGGISDANDGSTLITWSLRCSRDTESFDLSSRTLNGAVQSMTVSCQSVQAIPASKGSSSARSLQTDSFFGDSLLST
jgi:hypothetical protein